MFCYGKKSANIAVKIGFFSALRPYIRMCDIVPRHRFLSGNLTNLRHCFIFFFLFYPSKDAKSYTFPLVMEGKTLRVFFYVRRMRFELTHRCRHYPLKVACLPIPPPAHIEGVPRTGLEPACLSTHAPETCASTNSATWAYFNFFFKAIASRSLFIFY